MHSRSPHLSVRFGFGAVCMQAILPFDTPQRCTSILQISVRGPRRNISQSRPSGRTNSRNWPKNKTIRTSQTTAEPPASRLAPKNKGLQIPVQDQARWSDIIIRYVARRDFSPTLHPVGTKSEPENNSSRATYNLTIDIYKALENSPWMDTLWIWCWLYSNNTRFGYSSKMQPHYIANLHTHLNVTSIIFEVSGTPSFSISCRSRGTQVTLCNLEHAIQNEVFRSGQYKIF